MNPRWGAYAPWPFVGATALLLIVILLTPVLISLGEPAPGILTQAELGVDRVAGSNTTHFYVRPLGGSVRYAAIWAAADENASDIGNWTGRGGLNWTQLHYARYWNGTDLILLGFNSTANPVAVNITACYSSGSGDELYYGEFVFYVGPGPSGAEQLFATTSTSGVTVSSTTPVSALPYWIYLSSTPTSCPNP